MSKDIIKRPILKKGTTANGLTTVNRSFVGFELRKTQVIGWCLKPQTSGWALSVHLLLWRFSLAVTIFEHKVIQ